MLPKYMYLHVCKKLYFYEVILKVEEQLPLLLPLFSFPYYSTLCRGTPCSPMYRGTPCSSMFPYACSNDICDLGTSMLFGIYVCVDLHISYTKSLLPLLRYSLAYFMVIKQPD